MSEVNKEIILLYDGECPICTRYREYVELRKKYNVQLYNAREHPDLIERLRKQGYNIDEGMILLVDGQTFHKHEAIVMLERMTESKGWWDTALRKVMEVPFLMKICYPFLFFIRWVLLKWQRKKTKI